MYNRYVAGLLLFLFLVASGLLDVDYFTPGSQGAKLLQVASQVLAGLGMVLGVPLTRGGLQAAARLAPTEREADEQVRRVA